MTKKYLMDDFETHFSYMSHSVTVLLERKILRALEKPLRVSIDPVDDALTLTLDPELEIS